MKETGVGEFEEVILLLVGILGEEAYAYKIGVEFKSQTSRTISVGAVHSALNRLDEKGLLTSEMGEPTADRGGRRKRIYSLTAYGKRVLKESREFRLGLWAQYPAFAK
jgi:DNA-binding PadR family transcriptional regulator